MLYLTRRERFSSAHRLFNPEWSEEKNYEAFGKCANINWHGHNYELFITIKGEVNEELGYVMDLKTLGEIVKEKIIEKLDHKNLNLDVDFLKGKIVSTENIAVGIWNELDAEIKSHDCELHCIKVVETENNSVEYFGGK